MDLQQLQATRAQLLYEFGEIEYEKKLHTQRLKYLEDKSIEYINKLQEIEEEIDNFDEKIEKND